STIQMIAQPTQSAIQLSGCSRKIEKASPSQAAPRRAGASATCNASYISAPRPRSRERVRHLAGVRDVVLEQPLREGVVLLDRHVSVAGEVVVAEPSQPGAQRGTQQHTRPEA